MARYTASESGKLGDRAHRVRRHDPRAEAHRRQPDHDERRAVGEGEVDGVGERHVAARTSVMNLVVVARQPEIGEHCAAIISQLTGRHPSRTLICSPTDPWSPPAVSDVEP